MKVNRFISQAQCSGNNIKNRGIAYFLSYFIALEIEKVDIIENIS
jgi:hypothetical protein